MDFKSLYQCFCSIVLCSSAGLIVQNTHAAAYSLCSEQRTADLILKFKLSPQSVHESYPSYTSCIVLADQKQLLAITQPVDIQEEGSADYDLNLYLIDPAGHQIIKHYTETYSTSSDAHIFEGIQFDPNAYSRSEHHQMVGLSYQHGHLGGDSYTLKELKLFELNAHHDIRLVLNNFRTDFEGGSRPYSQCDGGGMYTRSKILLIPQNTLSHGLNDFKLKETVDREETDPNTCKVHKTTQHKTHQLQFNGEKYLFEHLDFLDFGI